MADPIPLAETITEEVSRTHSSSSQVMVSEMDVNNIAHDAKLDYNQLDKLFAKLGIEARHVDRERRNADTPNYEIQARHVLNFWRKRNGHLFTRQTIIDALLELECDEAVRILAESWEITLEKFATKTTSESDSIIQQCIEELRTYYIDFLCKIPIFPGDMEQCVDLKDIYTNVSIDIYLPKPCRPIKIPLKSLDDMFTRKTDESRFYKKLLIAAPAGFGKTISTAKLAYDWAFQLKGSPLVDVSLLLVINMRWVNHTTNLEDAILSQILPNDTQITEEQLRKIMRELGDKVVIILDAIDESDRQLFNHPKNSGSIVKLLMGKILVSCRLIVTTRPWRVPEIIKSCKAFTRLDLGGFSKEDVKAYIRKFFKDKEGLQESLIKYMEQNATIADICSVPLMTLLICVYWKESKAAEIPNRVGKLYDAILEIMHAHMQSKKDATHEEGEERIKDLSLIMHHLGLMALEGLWPPENRIVFSINELSDHIIVEDACQMGLVSKQEERGHLHLLARKRDVQPAQETKITFFHKSAQEKCAGEYLASLANRSPREHESSSLSTTEDTLAARLSSLSNMEDALAVQLVLRFASDQNFEAAKSILHRLVALFGSVQPMITRFFDVALELDDTLRIQEFLELCLDCNYEAQCQGEFNSLLKRIFPAGKVYFLGISASTAVALGYYMENAQPGDIKSITLQSTPHAGDSIDPVGPLQKQYANYMAGVHQLSSGKMNEICQEYFKKCQNVHSTNTKYAEVAPAVAVALIQMWQACTDLPVSEHTNIGSIITSLQYTRLESFSITDFKIRKNMNQLLEAFEKGHMSHLQQLEVGNIGMSNDQVKRLAKAIKFIPQLEVLDTSKNDAEEALAFMAESLTELKSLKHLNVSTMSDTAAGTGAIAEKLDEFGSQLLRLNMDGNVMDDRVAMHLEAHLPAVAQLVRLELSVKELSRKHHNLLLSTIRHLTVLQVLGIFHSQFPDDLITTVGDVMESLSLLNSLTVGVDDGTSPQVCSEAWNQLAEKLQKAEQLRVLQLGHVALERKDFQEFVKLCRRMGLQHVSYYSSCLPKDEPVPGDEFVHLY